MSATNNTNRPFSYHYLFKYTPQTKTTIKFLPQSERRFVIIKNFPAGKYQIEGISIISGRTPGVETGVGGASMFSTPVPFEIVPSKISVFPAIMVTNQDWSTGGDSWTQSFNIIPMDEDDVNNLIDGIKSLPNSEHWKINK